jgi:hypothetical protein
MIFARNEQIRAANGFEQSVNLLWIADGLPI